MKTWEICHLLPLFCYSCQEVEGQTEAPYSLRPLPTYIPPGFLPFRGLCSVFIPTGLALPSVLTFKEQGEGAAIFSLGCKRAGSKGSEAACGALDTHSHSLSLSLPNYSSYFTDSACGD